MLGLVKHYTKLALVPVLYFTGFWVMFKTIFKEAKWGLFLLIFLIPQPNIWYKLHSFPLGKDFLDLLFISIFCGILYQKKGFEKTVNSTFIILFVIVSYCSLWISSFNFSLPMPISPSSFHLMDWKNYAQMILIYFLVLNVIKNDREQKILIILISLIVLIIAVRSFRNFSGGVSFDYGKRASGPFYIVGLGANHSGAFFVDYASCILGILLFAQNIGKKEKILYLFVVLFSMHPIFFSYSRGAYLACVTVIILFGLVKKQMMVLIIIVLLGWQTLLPPSVVDRVSMTQNESGEMEDSAAGRLELWEFAIELFLESPIYGVGYRGYSMSVGGLHTSTGGDILGEFDTHSMWFKTLSEQGIIGIVFFLLVFVKAFLSGLKLFKISTNTFQKGLGYGFMACSVAVAITNVFGDRWSYYVLGSYFWVFWGLVDRSILNVNKLQSATS